MKRKYDISYEELKKWSPPGEDPKDAEKALEGYAAAHALHPPSELKAKILQKINKLNKEKNSRKSLDIHALPLLEEGSNWMDWADAVKDINPPAEYDDYYLHPLESNEKREIFVIWVKDSIPEEIHHDVLESFLILEGSCECHITDANGKKRIERLGQGDFITMKLNEEHDIVITSNEPAKGILQWIKLAA